MMAAPMVLTSYSSDCNLVGISPKEFPQFVNLNEDIIRLILSFIADGPFEHRLPGPVHRYRPGSLTESLSLVNRQFHHLSNLDYFWEPALRRQLEKPVWKEGMRRLLPFEESVDEHADLLRVVHENLEEKLTCKQIYEKIVTQHIHFEGPVFIMPCHLRLGEMYGLHLFEPRYRVMIRLIMEYCDNPEEAMFGGKIRATRVDGMIRCPLFIHACNGSRLGRGDLACLVQVLWCRTYPHGTADVRLLPVAWVRFENIWVQESAGHLFFAKVTRNLG